MGGRGTKYVNVVEVALQQKRTQSQELLPRLYKRLALADLLTQRLRQLTT